MQYRLSPIQSQHGFHNMIPPVNQGNGLRGITPDLAPSMAPRSYAMPPASYVGSAYPVVPGLQHSLAYPGGITSHRPLNSSPSSVPHAVVSGNSTTSSGTSKSSGGQVEGNICYFIKFKF